MKNVTIVFSVLVLLVSCGQKASDTTTLKGRITGLNIDEVSISIGEKLDTTLVLRDSSFSVKLPVDKSEVGLISAGSRRLAFISDGTVLEAFVSSNQEDCKVKSKSPKISATEKLYAYQNVLNEFWRGYNASMGQLVPLEEDSPEEYNQKAEELMNKAVAEYRDILLKTLEKNGDNVLSIAAIMEFRNLPNVSPEEIDALIKKLSPELLQNPDIQALQKGLVSKINTAEGKMFTDFTVVQDPSSAATSTVKLSDYVGKGKYILVDFWASWCEPCRDEIPNIKDVYSKFKGDKFDILSVAVWDDPMETERAASALGITWNQIVNSQGIATELYGIEGIPHIILFGPDGTILKRNLRGMEIMQTVSSYLNR